MSKLCLVYVTLIFMGLVAGCSAETDGEIRDMIEVSPGASLDAMAPNAMAPNAMAPNAMAPNAMAPNALTPAALGMTALSTAALGGVAKTALTAPTENGALARQLLKYSVSCALTPEQEITLTWIGVDGAAHVEVYAGLLGIAPSWADEPLTDDTLRRLVTGCLAARVNYHGVPVLLSLRSLHAPLALTAGDDEIADFPRIEGVFWGDVFSASPHVQACYEPDNAEHSRSLLRECATGHLASDGSVVPCGIITLAGPCDLVCGGWDSGGEHYTACVDHPGSKVPRVTTAVVTTALP